MTGGPACSEEMQAYFSELSRKNEECYDIARKARSMGFDPMTDVEIPQAEDLASRVEKLLADYHVEGVAEDIRRLTAELGNRELVALMVAREMAKRPAESQEKALDRAVRVGLAVLTEGILVAPLEGIADTRIGRNSDGSTYVDLIFAGPIRAAGGTGQAMSVLIADVVRTELGIGKYIPTEGEIARFDEEIPLYKQCQHLQYTPTSEEIDLIVRNCPVCVDGEGTETMEISGFRDLPRIETNRVRGGACLVIAEGMCQKASKLKKHVDKLGMTGWEFIGKYLDAHKADKKPDANSDAPKKVEPKEKYLMDIVAGRPIFGHPCAVGGFRLRYGRARTSGLASLAYSVPAMYVMDEFMAIGTQLKIERPGKASVVTPCDQLEGPTVLLKNGDLVYVGTAKQAIEIHDQISEIVDNGEILVPFGEFCENNHTLVPCGYPIEWHELELKEKGELPADWRDPTYERAKEMCATMGVPLHPKFNLFWSDWELDRIKSLREHVLATGSYDGVNLSVSNDPVQKRMLEDLCALHVVRDGRLVIDEVYSMPMLDCLGVRVAGDRLEPGPELEGSSTLEAISRAAGYEVRARAMTRIGTRMGRPEKAKEREMTPKVHSLFPVGKDADAGREMNSAIAAARSSAASRKGGKPEVTVDVGNRMCPVCRNYTFRNWCRVCGSHTEYVPRQNDFGNMGPAPLGIPLEEEFKAACEQVGERPPSELKCLDALISKTKTCEAVEKGILRQKNGISTFKDGTVRFDMTDIPLTHFKPREIGGAGRHTGQGLRGLPGEGREIPGRRAREAVPPAPLLQRPEPLRSHRPHRVRPGAPHVRMHPVQDHRLRRRPRMLRPPVLPRRQEEELRRRRGLSHPGHGRPAELLQDLPPGPQGRSDGRAAGPHDEAGSERDRQGGPQRGLPQALPHRALPRRDGHEGAQGDREDHGPHSREDRNTRPVRAPGLHPRHPRHLGGSEVLRVHHVGDHDGQDGRPAHAREEDPRRQRAGRRPQGAEQALPPGHDREPEELLHPDRQVHQVRREV